MVARLAQYVQQCCSLMVFIVLRLLQAFVIYRVHKAAKEYIIAMQFVQREIQLCDVEKYEMQV